MDSPGLVILGGTLIGLAFAGLRLLTGRLMSGSAMIGSLLGGREGLAAASIAFIAGLFVAPSIPIALAPMPPAAAEPGWLPLIAGGVLLGFGARLGDSGLVRSLCGALHRSLWAAGGLVAVMAGAGTGLFFIHAVRDGGGT